MRRVLAYAQSGIKSVPNAVGCASVHAKALIDELKRIDDVRYPATLDALERRIEEFKNRNRSFLTDLGSRKHVEDAVDG